MAKLSIKSVLSKLQYPNGLLNGVNQSTRTVDKKIYHCWALHRDIDKFKSIIEELLIRNNAHYELNVRASSNYYDKQFLYDIELTLYKSPATSTKTIEGE